MSKIINFLKGLDTDTKGRKLEQIIAWSDAELEESHDTIQWLFPLNASSAYNIAAPVLTDADIVIMKTDVAVQAGILKAYDRFTKFYNNPQWLTPHNHNYLRLTRILKCLGLAGLEKEKAVLKKVLNTIYQKYGPVIGPVTKRFWEEA